MLARPTQTLQVLAAVLFTGLALLMRGPTYWREMWPTPGVWQDFFQGYASALNWRNGQPIYTPHAETFPRYTGHAFERRPMHPRVNAHPPVAVVLMIPFSYLDYETAFFIWGLLGFALFWATCVVLARYCLGGWPAAGWIFLVGCFFLADPVLEQIHFGQMNFLLMGLLGMAAVCLQHNRQVIGGGLVGLAASLKLFPGFLLVYLLLRRAWRAVAGAVAAVGLSHALAFAILGTSVWDEYVQKGLPEAQRYVLSPTCASLTGLWPKLFRGNPQDFGVHALMQSSLLKMLFNMGSIVAIVGVLVWATVRLRGTEAKGLYELYTVGMLLLSPIVWNHYMIILVPTFMVFWRLARERIVLRAILFGCALFLYSDFARGLVLMCISKLTGLRPEVAQGVYPCQLLVFWASLLYCLIGLFAAGVVLVLRSNRR
ncbi:MAG: hypothetical protein C4297_09385 [Gemmataceae bacterium]